MTKKYVYENKKMNWLEVLEHLHKYGTLKKEVEEK